MRKILISLTGFLFLFAFGSIASATTAVVYKPSTSPCTTGDAYYNTIQSAVEALYFNSNGGAEDTVVVCPGTYVENITCPYCDQLHIMSYSQTPSDTIIQAADPDISTFFIGYVTSLTISGFKITGATGGFNSSCNNPILTDDEPQLCAGIRFYCLSMGVNGVIKNNYITGNNYGINMKDTAEWPFAISIEDNNISSNYYVGIKILYGTSSTIRNNYISDNPTGIELIDALNNRITGNTIISNNYGILSDNYFKKPSANNLIYNNKIINNTIQSLDNYACSNYWYEPSLLEGNYWSDYMGVDDGSGTGKHAIAGDGIGDTLIPHPDICYDEYPAVNIDTDNDGVIDAFDNCPDVYNPDQDDTDADRTGDVCDNDDDNDGLTDSEEAFLGADPLNPDTDGDRTIQVTTNDIVKSSPDVSGDRIVWQDYRNGNWDIYMYDISMGVETQITTDPSNHYSPAISGDRIVWEDYRDGNSDIYIYDISTGIETQTTTDPSNHYSPAISGDRIVWQDYRNGNRDIYMYNILTGQETQITSNTADQWSPAISGDRIAWEDDRNGNTDIYMYDISTGIETRITTDTVSSLCSTWGWEFFCSSQVSPAISGDRIVWEDHRNGNPDIYMYDVATGIETQITIYTSAQWSPAISGDRIVWQDYRNRNSDIYMYNILTGQETQITSNTADQYDPAISGDYIVWQEANDIFLYDYSLRDGSDNCPLVYNPDQADWNSDGVGDACDADSDGMPDSWETQYDLNPNDPDDASNDNDVDGLTNLEEYQSGTDPANPDTDNDGILDGDDSCPLVLPVKIGVTDYLSLQTAYDAAGEGDIIQSQAVSFTENLNINLNKSVILEGGYDCDYNDPPTGKTILNGNMMISDGTLTIEGGTFKVQ